MNLPFRHVSKLIALAFLPLTLWAGEVPRSSLLVVDTQKMINMSSLGERVWQQLIDEQEALRTENEAIDQALAQEEQEITDQRETLSPEAFTSLADAFDSKTQRLRAEQAAKLEALTQKRAAMANELIVLATPILEEIMREAGALALIDAKAIVLGAGYIDITDEAIERIDLALKDDLSLGNRSEERQ